MPSSFDSSYKAESVHQNKLPDEGKTETMKLNNSRIVLTGTSSGIGRELAELLLNRGAFIIGASLPGEQTDLTHENFTEVQVDVSTKQGVDYLFEESLKHLGRIDAFIANAGMAYYEKMVRADWEHLSAIVELNVKSVMYSALKMKELYPLEPFHFMATSSIMSYWPLPGYALYSGTKAAVCSFLEGLRLEWEKDQHLHIVFPVATKTRFFQRAGQPHKSWMMQTASHVAARMLRGLEKDKKHIYPSPLFQMCYLLAPWAISFYRKREINLLRAHFE